MGTRTDAPGEQYRNLRSMHRTHMARILRCKSGGIGELGPFVEPITSRHGCTKWCCGWAVSVMYANHFPNADPEARTFFRNSEQSLC